MNIIPGNLDDARIVDLLRHHREAALEVTPRESAHALDLEGVQTPQIDFFAAWDGEVLLGIGALKHHSADLAEIKSMHTVASERGKGVGAAMLSFLIEQAREHGHHRLGLETGAMDYFGPARALYRRYGFQTRDAFPP